MIDKFEYGKSYRCIDREGFIAENEYNEGYLETELEGVFCIKEGRGFELGGEGALWVSERAYVNNNEFKYFEEVITPTFKIDDKVTYNQGSDPYTVVSNLPDVDGKILITKGSGSTPIMVDEEYITPHKPDLVGEFYEEFMGKWRSQSLEVAHDMVEESARVKSVIEVIISDEKLVNSLVNIQKENTSCT